MDYFKKSLEIELPSNHKEHAESLEYIYLIYCNKNESYFHIGFDYFKRNEYDKALDYFNIHLKIMEQSFPKNYLGISHAYNNLGMIYYRINEYNKALDYFIKAIEFNDILPNNNYDIFNTYINIGLIFKNINQYDQAFAYLNKALVILGTESNNNNNTRIVEQLINAMDEINESKNKKYDELVKYFENIKTNN